MNLLPKDTDLIISSTKNENTRSKSAVEVANQPLLYDSKLIDQETNRFNFLTPADGDDNGVLRDNSPALLAMKNQKAKSSMKKPTFITPSSNSNFYDTTKNAPSFLVNKPLKPLGQNNFAIKDQKIKLIHLIVPLLRCGVI